MRGNLPLFWAGCVMHHLDYLQDLGITTLWMTPVIENVEARYEIEGIGDCVSPYCPLRTNNWAWQARIR